MESAEDIRKQILREYNKEPTGWQAYTGRDMRGHIDTVFVHGKNVWILKEELINPNQTVGFGVIDEMPVVSSIVSHQSFGFRPVTKRLIQEISAEKNITQTINSLLNRRPVSLHSLRSGIALEGPIMFSPKPGDVIPPKLRQIELELRLELDRLLTRRFPHLSTIYS